jgi:putative signal transducing protein
METVTVFRSADPNAQDDAAKIAEMLQTNGVTATLLDDSAPGVPEGVWEVRVAAAHSSQADELIAAHPIQDELSNPSQSHAFDMVTVFRTGAEMEAMTVHALLQSNGINAMIVGDARLPNLPEQVRVPREQVTEAKRLIASALATGSAGAEEAESTGE